MIEVTRMKNVVLAKLTNHLKSALSIADTEDLNDTSRFIRNALTSIQDISMDTEPVKAICQHTFDVDWTAVIVAVPMIHATTECVTLPRSVLNKYATDVDIFESSEDYAVTITGTTVVISTTAEEIAFEDLNEEEQLALLDAIEQTCQKLRKEITENNQPYWWLPKGFPKITDFTKLSSAQRNTLYKHLYGNTDSEFSERRSGLAKNYYTPTFINENFTKMLEDIVKSAGLEGDLFISEGGLNNQWFDKSMNHHIATITLRYVDCEHIDFEDLSNAISDNAEALQEKCHRLRAAKPPKMVHAIECNDENVWLSAYLTDAETWEELEENIRSANNEMFDDITLLIVG